MRACVCIYIKRTWLPKKCSHARRLLCANGDSREGEWYFSKEVSQEEREERPPPKYPPKEAPCCLGKPSSGPRHIGDSVSPGFGWPPSATSRGRGRSSHPRWAFSSRPPPCSSAGSAWPITGPRELIWGFLIGVGGLSVVCPAPFWGHPALSTFSHKSLALAWGTPKATAMTGKSG